ncbi:uncharacterized protein LOC110097619 isoform X2 [Dendrobium catenatum]|uniref:uncharacterized protein LOC110097619 isoform X2 n=1 Tax=Dendrobium catenatum TaxID=906689 RepID=UPI0009F1D80A|nr:uncharacterized protein LOC110097619 isoform X2 [Dendrobium catenatum]
MDDYWRFRPIPDDRQLCPACSIPHYPFCPSPPAFAADNFRFRSSDFRPPLFDRPFYIPSPSSGTAFLGPPSHQPLFIHGEVVDRESFRKRMRVEDAEVGVFPPFQPLNRAFSVDDERRLNLIRDHGREGTTQVHNVSHWNNNSDYRMDGDGQDVLQKHFGSSGINHGLSESEIYPRDGRFHHAKGYEAYPSQPIYNLDREDRRDFERMEFGSDRRGPFDSQIGGDYSYRPSAQLDRNLQAPRFGGSDDALGASQNFASVVPGEYFRKDSWRPGSYSTNDDNTSRVGNFNDQQQTPYSTNDYSSLRVGNFHDQQQAHPMPSCYPLLPKQPSHPHTEDHLTATYGQEYATQNHMESKSEFYKQKGEMMRNCLDDWRPIPGKIQKPLDLPTYPAVEQLGPHTSKQAGDTPAAAYINHVMGTSKPEQGHTSQAYPPIPPQPLFPVANHVMGTSIPDHGHTSQVHPPIPAQPLFPIQTEASLSSLQATSSVSATNSVVSPVRVNTLAKRLLSVYGSQSLPQGELYSDHPVQASKGFAIEGSPFIHQPSSNFDERRPSFPVKQSFKEKPAYVDASRLFKQPYRASRPDRIVIILRGLPGSGKSYLAKAIRDIEVENGGNAPRIHAMDDYFMIEVEKVEDNEGFKSTGPVRSKKQITKKVIEYCYEPEMEEAYRSSMLKAFKKTMDDGIFTFVIVDDRNLRVADFAQFWAIAKRLGYEVYLLEATYKDPAGCAARNIHGFKLADIQKMAEQWEEAPPLYLHLDIQSLFGGDDLIDQSIQEVDMDTDDTAGDGEAHHSQENDDCNSSEPKSFEQESDHGSTKLGKRWSTEEEEIVPGKNELERSKWSKDLSVDRHDSKSAIGNTSALSGLIQAYGKGVNFVHWGDKVDTSGFSIGTNKKQSASSLIIGPGAGYNLKSNPLPEDNTVAEITGRISLETKKRFNEQLRAERESFRAVFDRRRLRVDGLLNADDD